MRGRLIKLAVCMASVSTAGSLGGSAIASGPPDAKPRDLNTHRIFTPPSDRKVWTARAKALREQILFSAGLWPMPDKTPLNPRITGKIVKPDYTVENVAIETLPGFYLCGNLYRPRDKAGKHPGIVNPHGHWAHGRLEMQPDVTRASMSDKMGEGKGNLVSIGVNLARQGHVVFAYDMVGYNDTIQVDHKFAGNLRPWLWNVSLMGLQLWNSIRVIDYLQSLPDVDPNRIGVTGASGGGTQTFLLSAVDDRVKAAVPVNMISATMAGGCLCENGPGLRVETDNAEIGAVLAPKPLLLVAATGDWTVNNPKEEWPAIKSVYDLYGAGDRTAVQQFNYQHNYNIDSREAMYGWFGRWLLHKTDLSDLKEKPFEADVQAMHVWNDKNRMPANALKEPALIEAMMGQARDNLAKYWPHDQSSLATFRRVYGAALEYSLGVQPPSTQRGASEEGLRGKRQALIVSAGEASAESLKTALEGAGYGVTMVSLAPITTPGDMLWKDFFVGYNRTPVGDRVKAIVDQMALLRSKGARSIDVIGMGSAGLWTLLARGLYRVPGKTVADVQQFKDGDDTAFIERLYAPGLRRAGDVSAAAVLNAGPLYLANTGSSFDSHRIAEAFVPLDVSLTTAGSTDPDRITRWLAEGR